MEASALQAPAGIARQRLASTVPLLRLRSDEQLVALFRQGHDEAFRVIHDRYRQRLFAYTRQMLPGSRQDAEDALQDVFVRAYAALRASDRELALRAWLYRVAHNRCIDELRRPATAAPELIELVSAPISDPIAEAERRESLRRLIADIRRLPDQQRSALLLRELSGMSYTELAEVLGVSVPAIKSLLVRARVGLAQAAVARDTACSRIREELILAHDRGVRPDGNARRHLRDCSGCNEFRREMRGVSRQIAAFAPTVGPMAVLANLLGFGGAGGAAAGGGVAAGGVAGGGVFVSGGVLAAGASHVATLLAAAAVTAGGAVDFQQSITAPIKHPAVHHPRATTATSVTASVPTGSMSQITVPGAVVSSSVSASDAVVSRTVPTIARDIVVSPARRTAASPNPGSRHAGSGGGSGTPPPASTPTSSTTTGSSTGTDGSSTTAGATGSTSTTGPSSQTTDSSPATTGTTSSSGTDGTASTSGTTGAEGSTTSNTSGSTATTAATGDGSTSTGTPGQTSAPGTLPPAGH